MKPNPSALLVYCSAAAVESLPRTYATGCRLHPRRHGIHGIALHRAGRGAAPRRPRGAGGAAPPRPRVSPCLLPLQRQLSDFSSVFVADGVADARSARSRGYSRRTDYRPRHAMGPAARPAWVGGARDSDM